MISNSDGTEAKSLGTSAPAEQVGGGLDTQSRNSEKRVWWKREGLAQRAAGVLWARWLFRGHQLGKNVVAARNLRVDLQGSVCVGNRVQFIRAPIPGSIVVHPGARLEIGNEVCTYGASIEAHQLVTIGDRCMFAMLSRIGDRDHEGTAPIVIENDVWVAYGAIVCPGVTIGNGSVVAAGSVVTKDVPPKSLAIGNPARAISLTLRTGKGQSL